MKYRLHNHLEKIPCFKDTSTLEGNTAEPVYQQSNGFKLILTMFVLWCFREHRYRRATKNMAIQHFATAQLWSRESRLIIQLWNVAHELKPTHTTPVPSISIRVSSISELNNSFSTSESIQYRRVHKYQNFLNVNWPRIHNFEYQIKYLIMIWRCIY